MALQIVNAEAPDILISDLMLPEMSGVELLEAARETDPNLVVIITTGYSTVDNAVASLKKGGSDFLPKPFTFEELLSPVHRAVRFLDLPLAVRNQCLPANSSGCYCLGLQTWARIEEDGSAQLGLSNLFLKTVDDIEGIEFPDADADLRQGGRLTRCTTSDRLVHEAWSPLSGRVLEVNSRLQQDPSIVHQGPLDGWLARIFPTNLDTDLANLTRS